VGLRGRKWQKVGEDHIMRRFITLMKSRGSSWAGKVTRVGDMINVYKIFLRKSEGKLTLGRSRRRLHDNIRVNLRLDSSGSG
jgi:hypothetical protein